MRDIPSCFFQPWIGSHYHDGFGGARLLLLGESHYDDQATTPDAADFTRRVVKDWAIDGPRTTRFFTVSYRAITKAPVPSREEREAFWESVAFYNYVQRWVGHGPRDRPSEADWASGAAPFEAVLSVLRPHAVLVLGTELWRAMPARFWSPTNGVTQDSNAPCRFTLSDWTGVASWIRHPSTAFRYERWTPRIESLLSSARQLATQNAA